VVGNVPPVRSTRAPSSTTAEKSSTSVWENMETTASKWQSGKGRAAASACTRSTSPAIRSRARRSWSEEKSTPVTCQPSATSVLRCTPVPQHRSRQRPDPTPSSWSMTSPVAAVYRPMCSSYQEAKPSYAQTPFESRSSASGDIPEHWRMTGSPPPDVFWIVSPASKSGRSPAPPMGLGRPRRSSRSR
jgi:hypothetical protein